MEAFIDNLTATDRTPGHIEGTRVHLDHFIRVLGDVRIMSMTDADMTTFLNKRGKEKAVRKKSAKQGGTSKKTGNTKRKKKLTSKRLISQGTIRSDFKSFRSAVNWAMNRKPPLLTECPFTIPKITETTVNPFLPTEEINRLIDSSCKDDEDTIHARWLLDLAEINRFVEVVGRKMPEMALPIKLVYSTGMRRIQLMRLRPSDYINGRLMIRSKKGARERGLSEITLAIELRDAIADQVAEHVKQLPKRTRILFPIFDQFDYTRAMSDGRA